MAAVLSAGVCADGNVADAVGACTVADGIGGAGNRTCAVVEGETERRLAVAPKNLPSGNGRCASRRCRCAVHAVAAADDRRLNP